MKFAAPLMSALICTCTAAADEPRTDSASMQKLGSETADLPQFGEELPSRPKGGVWLFGVQAYSPITTLYAFSVVLTYPSGSKITSSHTIPLAYKSSLVPDTRAWAQVSLKRVHACISDATSSTAHSRPATLQLSRHTPLSHIPPRSEPCGVVFVFIRGINQERRSSRARMLSVVCLHVVAPSCVNGTLQHGGELPHFSVTWLHKCV
jgi:hypothetical protein